MKKKEKLEPVLLNKKTFWERLRDEKYLQFMAICGVVTK